MFLNQLPEVSIHPALPLLLLTQRKERKKLYFVEGIPFPENDIWSEASHALLVGSNKSGKTYLLHYLIVKMVTDERYTSTSKGWNKNTTRTIFYLADFKWESLNLLTALPEDKVVLHIPEGFELKIRDSAKLQDEYREDIEHIIDVLPSITRKHKSVSELIENFEEKKVNIIGDDALLRERGEEYSQVQSQFFWKLFEELVMKTKVLDLSPATFFYDEGGNYLPAHGKGYRKGIERQSSSISNLLRKSRSAFMNNIFSALSYNDLYSDIRSIIDVTVFLAQTLNELGKIAESPLLRALNTSLNLFKKVSSEGAGQYIETMRSKYSLGFYYTRTWGDAFAVNIPHLQTLDGRPYRTFLIPAYFEGDKKPNEIYADIKKSSGRKKKEIITDVPVEDIFGEDENEEEVS